MFIYIFVLHIYIFTYYIYIYIYAHTYIYIYIYTFINNLDLEWVVQLRNRLCAGNRQPWKISRDTRTVRGVVFCVLVKDVKSRAVAKKNGK